jgi:hypothetical protein
MEKLAIVLAINGALVLMTSLLAGVFLYRTLLKNDNPHGWHLLHAGGSGRAVMLLALASAIHLAALPVWLISATVLAIILFAWASTISMIITAITGEHGFSLSGPLINRLAHVLYIIGAAAVFPAVVILIYGFAAAL